MVVFPTPPLLDPTAMMFWPPGNGIGCACGGPACICPPDDLLWQLYGVCATAACCCSSPLLPIDLRVQRGIVVHLQLPIELKTTPAGIQIVPEAQQILCQIAPLLLENLQPFEVAAAMFLIRVFSLRLFARVVELERQNRQTINHHSWSLRVKLSRFRINMLERLQ